MPEVLCPVRVYNLRGYYFLGYHQVRQLSVSVPLPGGGDSRTNASEHSHEDREEANGLGLPRCRRTGPFVTEIDRQAQ